MAEMDLIPNDYRRNRARRSLLRKFLYACGLVLAIIILSKTLLTYMIWSENVGVVKLEQQLNITEQNKARAAEFQQRKQVTEKQLAALNELRGRDRVAQFLQAIDVSLNEGVWFDSIHFMRHAKTTTLSNSSGAPASGIIVVGKNATDAEGLNINQGVEIVGHAASHTLLAEFMRKLGAQPNIVDLRLLNTSLRNYTTMQVVDFSLNLVIDTNPEEAS